MSPLTTLGILLLCIGSPLPYGVDKGPPARRAPVTLFLVAVNLTLFVATHVTAHGLIDPNDLYERYGLTPSSYTLVTLVTYMFLHVSVMHVVWNMAVLYLFGPVVEERVGNLLYGALYLTGGVAAGLLHVAIKLHFTGDSSAAYVPLVGASGAISAVLGLFTVFASGRLLKLFWPLGFAFGKGWQNLEIPAGIGVAVFVGQMLYGAAKTLFSSDSGGVAYFAHIGGFVFGIACGLIGGLNHHGWRSAQPGESSPEPVAAGAERTVPRSSSAADVLTLLERAIHEGDYERAATLYEKCRAFKAGVPQQLLDRLNDLEAERGESGLSS